MTTKHRRTVIGANRFVITGSDDGTGLVIEQKNFT